MPALAPPALAPALPSRPSAVAAAPCPGGGAVREWGEESGEGGIDLEVETPRAEAVGGVCQVGVKVAGRLRACSAGWAEIGASAEVMAMVTEGYRLPLTRWGIPEPDDAMVPPPTPVLGGRGIDTLGRRRRWGAM